MSNPRDLQSLKARLTGGQTVPMRTLTGPHVRAALEELDSLKQFIRDLYQSAISAEDARDFTYWTQEHLGDLIRSWGETPMTPEEYMEAQQVAQQRADDEAEFERLKKKLGR